MGSKKKKSKKDSYFLYRFNEFPEDLDAFAEAIEEFILKDKKLFGDSHFTITKEVQNYVWEDLDDYERGKGDIVRKELNYKVNIEMPQMSFILHLKLLFVDVADVLELQYDFFVEEGPRMIKMAVRFIRNSFKKRFVKRLEQVSEDYSPT